MKFINIGYGNMVAVDRIVTLVSPDSAPIKRLIQDAKDDGRVIDVTCGRKTRAVIITDSTKTSTRMVLPSTVSAVMVWWLSLIAGLSMTVTPTLATTQN